MFTASSASYQIQLAKGHRSHEIVAAREYRRSRELKATAPKQERRRSTVFSALSSFAHNAASR